MHSSSILSEFRTATSVLAAFQDLGIRSRPIRFLRVYLKGHSFAAKLGATISDLRPHNIGLPQGSALSPVFFCARMYRAISVQTIGYVTAVTYIYADDI